ncbi:MAG: hypothetical protein HRU24_13195 [Gammaproteobacteria bacterium]|nr:hypothetical protein [Gammaproteobacteria bacterium]
MTGEKLPPTVQFFDNLSEITAMRDRRFSAKLIWQTLQKEDKYDGDYTYFCRLLKKEFNGESTVKSGSEKVTSSVSISSTQQKSQSIKSTQSETSKGEPLMYMSDLDQKK